MLSRCTSRPAGPVSLQPAGRAARRVVRRGESRAAHKGLLLGGGGGWAAPYVASPVTALRSLTAQLSGRLAVLRGSRC